MQCGFTWGLAAGSLAILLASNSAIAQTAPAGAAAETQLDEVVVTARRRSEALQDVPVSVAVLNASALETEGVHTEADLELTIPGLVILSGNNNNELNYVMRGESVDAYSGSPPGVQPYIDEVPFPVQSSTAFYDLNNVQAVKGPQGTLFGRNSTGGAVLFETQSPTNEFGGYASVQYGNLDRLITEAAVNLPLVSDRLLIRLAGTVTSGGAYVRNLYDGSMLGDKEERSGRITIEARPIDNLTNLTTIQLGHTTGTDAPNTAYYTVPCGQPSGFNSCTYSPANQPFFSNLLSGKLFPGYPSGYVYPGGFATLEAFQRSQGTYVIDQNAGFRHDLENDFIINKTTFDLAKDLSIKNIFGYSFAKNQIGYDTDYSPYPIVQMYSPSALVEGLAEPTETSTTTTYSDELQLTGEAFESRLNYLVGVFFIDSTEAYFSPLWLGDINASVAYQATTDDKSYAGFTQETYKLTDQLNLTVGGRYTVERVNMVQGEESIFGVGNPQHDTEDKPSWTVSLDYHFNNDFMVYATTRGSWRRGGFNPFNPPTATPTTAAQSPGGNFFLPETIRDVEGGFKLNTHVVGMPLQANVAVYNSWITDIQKTAYTVIAGTVSSATINVPKSRIWGIETDANIRPVDWLRLGGAASYTDARFTDAQSSLFGSTVTYGPFGDTPRFSGSIYAETKTNLPQDAGSLNYHVDLYGQSSFYFSNLGGTVLPGTQLPGYRLLNMRLDWADIYGKGLKASLFVKNLTNKLYYTGGSAGAQDFSVESATFGLPRTYGVYLRKDF
jgi:iron complex outermembrane recepter protein